MTQLAPFVQPCSGVALIGLANLYNARMPDPHSREHLESIISRLLKGELPEIRLPDSAASAPICVRPLKTTGGARPDGLREDVTIDPGFSFAVSEGLIEVDRAQLDEAQFERVHRILWEAGTDDWMDYSHIHQFDAEGVPGNATVALSFSSAGKAANVLVKVLAALSSSR